MFDALRRPLPLVRVAAGTAGATFIVAFYCVAYTSLVGRGEGLGEALAWAIANVSPWLLAIEAAKRAPNIGIAAGVVGLAAVSSLILGYVLGASSGPVLFELIRRLPALFAVTALVIALRSNVGSRRGASTEIQLAPLEIEWVKAAGNYVEVRANGRTLVHRGSISAAERHLSGHGFVRIHRSTLVRRDRISRIRPHDVILDDGTHLKVGKRYRALLAA